MNSEERANRLGPKVQRIANSFRRIADESTHELGITGVQSFLLGFLNCHREAPPCQHDIEVRFNIKHPTATGILARLEEKGFVEFKSDKYDGRLKRIAITEAGVQAAEQTAARLDELDNGLAQGFSPEELATLHALLDRVVANAEDISRRTREEEAGK